MRRTDIGKVHDGAELNSHNLGAMNLRIAPAAANIVIGRSERRKSRMSASPIEEDNLARKTVMVSDLSGKEIAEGKGAVISIKFADARKGTIVLDVSDEEAEELGQKGRKQARRGRRPKAIQ